MTYDQIRIACQRALEAMGPDLKSMSWFKRNWKLPAASETASESAPLKRVA